MKFEDWRRRLSSKDSSERSIAADEIPEDGDISEVVKLLAKALGDEDEFVRTCAADSLAGIPNEFTKNALRTALEQEKSEIVLSFLVSSLGSVGDANDLLRISSINQLAHRQSRLLTHCSEAIVEIGVRVALQQLEENMQSENYKISGGALNALTRTNTYLANGIETARGMAEKASRKNLDGFEQVLVDEILRTIVSKKSS